MFLSDFLNEFALQWNLGIWVADDQGRYSVTFDENLEIQIEPLDRSRFVLRATLAPEPDDPQVAAELFLRLLKINLSQWHTQAETIGLDQERREILMFRIGNAEEMDQAGFSTWVEEFVNRLEFWHSQVQAQRSSVPSYSMVFP